MAQATQKVTEPQIQTWEIEGEDLVDKATLVGVPFTITGLCFKKGARNVDYVWCDFETEKGDRGTFSDSSSSGIKNQLHTLWLTKTGEDVDYTTEETWKDVRIIVSRGLRFSEYVPDGRKEKARTYYLAASGRRNRG